MSTRMSALMHLFCALVAMIVLSAPAHSQENPSQVERDKRMEFEFRYWFANTRASVNATENINGPEVGVRAGLGLNSNGAAEARYSWRFTGRHKLKIDYAQLSTNSSTADFALNLGGNFLSADNIDLSSLGSAEVDIKQVKIGYTWQGIKLGNRIRLGPLVDVRGILFDASLTVPSSSGAGGAVDRSSGMFGLGMLTLGTEVSAALHRRVEVTSALSFIPIVGLGRVFEADTRARFSLSKHLNLSAGYRYLRLRANEGPNFAELRLRGPFIGAGFRF
jgi:YfaZ precursor